MRPGTRHIHTLEPGETSKFIAGGDGDTYAVIAHPERPPYLLRLSDLTRINMGPAEIPEPMAAPQ